MSGAICAGTAHREAEHAEAHATGLLERRRAPGRDPHRWMRTRVRLRQHVARRHREEPAVVRILVVGPHVPELGDDLVEHLAREVGIVDAEAALLGRRRAASHAELEAAVAEVIEHRDPFGNARRMVHRRRHVEDARTEMDAFGARREVAEEHLVRRHVRVLGEEVVLGHPRVLEPRAVGGLDHRDLVHEPAVLGAGVAVAQMVRHVEAVEETELHGPVRLRLSSHARRLSLLNAHLLGATGMGAS